MSKMMLGFDDLVNCLEVAGEPTRLRLLHLLAQAELTVSEIVMILGQSQPRISRHLKLLADAGLALRHREGAWVFFRLVQTEPKVHLVQSLLAQLDPLDVQIISDDQQLQAARRQRDEQAKAYFAQHAPRWDQIRALHASDFLVEQALLELLGERPIGSLLDLGTGTGRMLELLAPRVRQATGIDQSSAMLALARARLDRAELKNVQLRQGDLFAPMVAAHQFDLVILHQVLHYFEEPQRALTQAARMLAPNGRLVVIDFAPHQEEVLRQQQAHRRLGFALEEINQTLLSLDLSIVALRSVPPAEREGEKLTVQIWIAQDKRLLGDFPDRKQNLGSEVA